MYDALRPFADALHENVSAGMPLLPAWQAAADVASEHATDTATLTPRLGRARPLAERSIGTPGRRRHIHGAYHHYRRKGPVQ